VIRGEFKTATVRPTALGVHQGQAYGGAVPCMTPILGDVNEQTLACLKSLQHAEVFRNTAVAQHNKNRGLCAPASVVREVDMLIVTWLRAMHETLPGVGCHSGTLELEGWEVVCPSTTPKLAHP
jgi:hypothetical protein